MKIIDFSEKKKKKKKTIICFDHGMLVEAQKIPKDTATLPPCLPVSPLDRAKAMSLSPLL